jgi:hypothetical protein
MTLSTGSTRRAADADTILEECRQAVYKGLGGKQLHADADTLLVMTFKPKIQNRLDAGGVWEDEKANPLIVAEHLGQIAAILTQGDEVSPTVAKAAAVAIQHDQLCPSGGGTGQWCF